MPLSMSIGCNENLELEHSWVREFTGGSKALIGVEALKPQVVFFMETKVDKKRMECVRRKLGFVNGIDVDADGSKG